MAQFNKIQFNEDRKHIQQPKETVMESAQYKLTKVNGVYTLIQKSDNRKIEVEKDKVEDFVMWGLKEFKEECKKVKF